MSKFRERAKLMRYFIAIILLLILSISTYGQERGSSTPTAVSAAVDEFMKVFRQGPVTTLKGASLSLFVMDVEKGTVFSVAEQVSADLNACGSPTWTKDGKRIAFDASPGTEYDRTRIKALEVIDGKLQMKDLGPGNCPSFSPDGKRMVFYLNPGVEKGVEAGMWVLQPDGKDCAPLTENLYGIPRWSVDGRYIMVKHFGNPAVVTLVDVTDPNKAIQKPVKLSGYEMSSLVGWADEGKTMVAIVKDSIGSFSIALIDVTDPPNAKIKQTVWKKGDGLNISVNQPAYSPVADLCIFAGKDEAGWALFKIRVGKDKVPTRIEPVGYGDPISSLYFSPDGRYMLFCAKPVKK